MMSEPLAAILQALPRRFRSYAEYKDSGVEWLGEIPMHWKVQRLKFAAHIEAGQSPSSESVAAGADGLPFLQGNAEFGPRHPVPHLVCNEASKRAKVGDLLLSVRAPVGALNIADQPYGIGRGLCAITPGDDFEPQFCYYVLWAVRSRLDAVSTGSTYEAVTASDVGDLPALLPSRHEQRAIGAFLDRETAKIDALVAKKERVIELLQEKRMALVTQAVIKGLDPNVPMKDSGVEWLGEIPAHWDLKPLSQLLSRITYGFTNPMPVVEEGPYMLTALDIGDGKILYESARRTTEEAFERNLTDKSRPRAGDILVTKDGTLGRVAVADGGRVCINQSVALLRFDPSSVSIDFVQNALRSAVFQERMVFEAGGTAIKHIYISRLAKMHVAVAPREEQDEICEFIARRRTQIDSLVHRVRDGIECLKQFRTALISDAVTGKIDVREGAA